MKREKPKLRSTHRGVAQLALPKWLSVWLLLTHIRRKTSDRDFLPLNPRPKLIGKTAQNSVTAKYSRPNACF
jgi:hypothetical protein